MDLIFEPFNRGSLAKGEGTGLGLSIVRRIVENHCGSINLQSMTSSEATGLRVTVLLPAALFNEDQDHDAAVHST